LQLPASPQRRKIALFDSSKRWKSASVDGFGFVGMRIAFRFLPLAGPPICTAASGSPLGSVYSPPTWAAISCRREVSLPACGCQADHGGGGCGPGRSTRTIRPPSAAPTAAPRMR
jgi:hypothetical protein